MCPFLCCPQSLPEVIEMLQSVFITHVFSLSHFPPDLEEKMHHSPTCSQSTYDIHSATPPQRASKCEDFSQASFCIKHQLLTFQNITATYGSLINNQKSSANWHYWPSNKHASTCCKEMSHCISKYSTNKRYPRITTNCGTIPKAKGLKA